MGVIGKAEASLGDVFKNAPKLPEGAKKAIVQYLPWITLVFGVFMLWTAYAVWDWARVANAVTDWVNSVSRAFEGERVSTSHFTVVVWLGIAVLIAEGILYLLAFPGLKDRKKQGWNLLFLAALVNVAYAVISLFSDYRGGFGGLLMNLIGAAVGFYVLFQIREYYTGRVTSAAKASTAKL